MYTVLYLCRHVLLYMQRTRRRCVPTALYVRVFVSLEGCVRCRLLLFLGGGQCFMLHFSVVSARVAAVGLWG